VRWRSWAANQLGVHGLDRVKPSCAGSLALGVVPDKGARPPVDEPGGEVAMLPRLAFTGAVSRASPEVVNPAAG
jgi:hypothetical protein